MAKRGLNIYKRKDGRWEGRICQKIQAGQKRRYRSVYGKSYREVKEKLTSLMSEQEGPDQKCSMTIREIIEIWLHDKKNVWKESTYACYKQLAERHIYREIGERRADLFTNACFHEYLCNIRKRDDGSKISPAYARNIGAVLTQSFYYMSKEYLYRLPALLYKGKPAAAIGWEIPAEKTMKRLEGYLLSHSQDSTCLGILLAYYTGIRIGELCALTWGDIDLEEGILKIQKNLQRVKVYQEQCSATEIRVQTPKTASSVRSIPIPGILIPILKRHKKATGQYFIAGRKKAWAETRTVQYRFAAILKICNIPHFKFHMLRHYFASWCIRQDFDVKSLSEILGHASVQVTLNLYVHSSMCRKRLLMNRLTEAA